MNGVAELIPGRGGLNVLLVADHASNHVPDGIDLGIDPALLNLHIAVDLGVREVTTGVAQYLGAPAIMGAVSRLVLDLNREPDAPGLVPVESDGHAIPGNAALTAAERMARCRDYHLPYHRMIDGLAEQERPRMLVSIHSFTRQLATRPDVERPWTVGILYNCDDRAGRLAIGELARLGIVAGDNEPYSGRELNYTMNRHAEARGLPYIGFEVRQDEIGDAAGIARWTEIIADVTRSVADRF